MATAVAAFRSLLRPTAVANSNPLPPSHFSFKSFQQHGVGLRLFSSHRLNRPILLPASAASGEEFSSDGEYYSEEEEEGEEYGDKEGEEAEPEVQAVRGYYPPRTRPALGQEPGRIYVGNLPYTFTASELTAAFSEAGSVDDVQIIYDKITDRSRGFAFVTMATAEEATKAVQMFNGALLGGRTVRVNFPEVPRGGERTVAAEAVARTSLRVVDDGTYKVYAGNLGWGVRADALKAAFEGQPGLVGSRVIFERDTGRSRGFGFLSFQTLEDANAAIQAMDGVELDGRPLRLSLASQNPPAGSTPSTVQSRQEETASDGSETEADMEESNLQTTASY
ncbi:RNA-binding protein CP33, chloroplastic-like [Lolium rigidum]|uniref:RNA-binding protein CP33, chloroplastic-like n=1 Tax=Lolium rigidum TaxID=89674 RepID=UPI001F5C3D7E|nr:RNA-binding protein CP33, chloroplastic-like [Lolium rigidum]